MKLIIIRGPSGSGKSTIAQALDGIYKVNWFEADAFFIGPDNSYNFNANLLGKAHNWCQNSVREAVKAITYAQSTLPPLMGKDINVIVSNTSTTLKELNDYIKIAKECCVTYSIIRTPDPWSAEELFRRNKHNVPKEVLERQIARYQPHPDEEAWLNMEIFK